MRVIVQEWEIELISDEHNVNEPPRSSETGRMWWIDEDGDDGGAEGREEGRRKAIGRAAVKRLTVSSAIVMNRLSKFQHCALTPKRHYPEGEGIFHKIGGKKIPIIL